MKALKESILDPEFDGPSFTTLSKAIYNMLSSALDEYIEKHDFLPKMRGYQIKELTKRIKQECELIPPYRRDSRYIPPALKGTGVLFIWSTAKDSSGTLSIYHRSPDDKDAIRRLDLGNYIGGNACDIQGILSSSRIREADFDKRWKVYKAPKRLSDALYPLLCNYENKHRDEIAKRGWVDPWNGY